VTGTAAVSPTLPAVPLEAPDDETRLRDALRLATGLVAAVRSFAFQFDFGDLELPSTISTPADQARLRAVAPLYFASELESARLLPALELLAGLWASGAIQTDLGPSGDLLIKFHRERGTRLTGGEREALFGRLFGKPYGPDLAVNGARNVGFDSLLTELAASLSDWHTNTGRWGGNPADAVRVRTAAAQLAGNLASRSGGVATFAAGEIVRDISLAVSVFKDPVVQRALGALSMWQAVQAVVQRFLRQDVDITSHVERARSGIVLLAWLADALPSLESGGAALPGEETVMHAIRWMQATLALHERGQVGGNAAGTAPGTIFARG
jgi:hypothetical protein